MTISGSIHSANYHNRIVPEEYGGGWTLITQNRGTTCGLSFAFARDLLRFLRMAGYLYYRTNGRIGLGTCEDLVRDLARFPGYWARLAEAKYQLLNAEWELERARRRQVQKLQNEFDAQARAIVRAVYGTPFA